MAIDTLIQLVINADCRIMVREINTSVMTLIDRGSQERSFHFLLLVMEKVFRLFLRAVKVEILLIRKAYRVVPRLR